MRRAKREREREDSGRSKTRGEKDQKEGEGRTRGPRDPKSGLVSNFIMPLKSEGRKGREGKRERGKGKNVIEYMKERERARARDEQLV